MVLLCGDGLFGPRAAEGTCSEGPSPISPWLCGGGAGGSFGNLGAAHSIVNGMTAIIFDQCILN